MLSERSSLYVTGPKTIIILKNFSLVKSNLLLNLVIQINIIFVLGILHRKYTLFFLLKVGPQTFFLSANFFIILLKNTKFYCSSSYNSRIFSIIITVYNTNFLYSLVSSKTSALNPLFIKNGVLLVVLCSEVLYVIILIGNNLTQLVC